MIYYGDGKTKQGLNGENWMQRIKVGEWWGRGGQNG